MHSDSLSQITLLGGRDRPRSPRSLRNCYFFPKIKKSKIKERKEKKRKKFKKAPDTWKKGSKEMPIHTRESTRELERRSNLYFERKERIHSSANSSTIRTKKLVHKEEERTRKPHKEKEGERGLRGSKSCPFFAAEHIDQSTSPHTGDRTRELRSGKGGETTRKSVTLCDDQRRPGDQDACLQ